MWHRDDVVIRPAVAADREWITSTLVERWGSTVVVGKGRQLDAASLEAIVAANEAGDVELERVGLLTYRLDALGLEVVTIDALVPGAGIGTALLAHARHIATRAGVTRLWLITTNDNLGALGFYERRGFRIIAVHRGAVDWARALKPSIPLIAENGIELHDELELELELARVAGPAPVA
ncbi:MAG TPA: GNAT family N-acetyltransferase, partial [Acidimicrobiales bacterium]|nr:GNAT family N-acetyltransferase [Acidimicrobiales bacterium]